MKSAPVILLAFLLAIPKAECQHKNFGQFVTSLAEIIKDQPSGVLPFLLTNKVIEYLPLTSYEFQSLCVKNDNQIFSFTGNYAPVVALHDSIKHILGTYRRNIAHVRGMDKLLDDIQKWDSIGLIIYLDQKNESCSSPNLIESITKYHQITIERVRLHEMRTETSYYTVFDSNPTKQLHINRVHIRVRNDISNEYEPPRGCVFNQFISLVEEVTKKKMYDPINDALKKYPEHKPITDDDVQILYDFPIKERDIEGKHPICIYYRASTQKVEVYDSARHSKLSKSQLTSIKELYPHNSGVEMKKPRKYPDFSKSHAYFAIAYATTLLLQHDPSQTEFKLNYEYGDVTLFMRIHLLNMLANRKLALFP